MKGIVVQLAAATAFTTLAFAPLPAGAHCDTLDGPVVAAGRVALERGEVTPVLRWVRPADEAEIRSAFDRTVAVRALSPEARELADRFFLETLVRVHRAGEGAPYSGLKAAGSEVEPGVRLADEAIRQGALEPLATAVTGHLHHALEQRWQRVLATAAQADDDVEAGRAHVAAYVDFVHFVEGVHRAVDRGPHADVSDPGPEETAHSYR